MLKELSVTWTEGAPHGVPLHRVRYLSASAATLPARVHASEIARLATAKVHDYAISLRALT